MELFRITKHLLSLMIKNRIVNVVSVDIVEEAVTIMEVDNIFLEESESDLVSAECHPEVICDAPPCVTATSVEEEKWVYSMDC